MSYFSFEHRRTPLAPLPVFLRRLATHFMLATTVIGGSLLLGMVGYHLLEREDWVQSFLDASMLLGGEGPLTSPRTESGKIFAGVYALYSGLVFLASIGIVFAPLFHRLLHKLHIEETEDTRTND